MPAPLLRLAEVLVGGFSAAVDLASAPAGVAAIAMVAAAVVLLTVSFALRTVSGPSAPTFAASAVRQRGERTVFLRLCDPDCAGRPRPRAPSSLPGVA